MKQMVVASGKGGTGKTTIAAAFAALVGRTVVADCDVDAATLHLLLNPKVVSEQEFQGSKLATIDKDRCTKCRLCEEACRYDAIRDLEVDAILCEGCGVCAHICPVGAIDLRERVSGHAYISNTRYGPMSHARLGAAEANSGKLVALVRQNARLLAEKERLDTILIDGPPGIGCPLIASLTGVDLAVIVAEPTLSGRHDLERVMAVATHFKVRQVVIINMHDINRLNTESTVKFCQRNGIRVIGMIPFDPAVIRAMVAGEPVVEYSPRCPASRGIRKAWHEILCVFGRGSQ